MHEGQARLQVQILLCMCVYFLVFFLPGTAVPEKNKIHRKATMFIFHQNDKQFLFACLIEFSASFWAFSQQQTLVQQPKSQYG